jgi:hypothetical protein
LPAVVPIELGNGVGECGLAEPDLPARPGEAALDVGFADARGLSRTARTEQRFVAGG